MNCCDLSGCSCDTTDLSGCPCDETDVSGNLPNHVDAKALVESSWGLRLRARIEELGVDLSQNVLPHTSSPIVSPLLNLNDIYVQSVFYFLRLLTMSGQALDFLWLFFGNIAQGVKKTFHEDVYVFFKNSSYPYLLDDIHLDSPGVPEIQWYYNAKTRTFLTARLYNTSQDYHPHHISYLTAEVCYNDLNLYDVSEFFNSIRWAGEGSMPSIYHLISAWSLSSGIVLKRSPHMIVAAINTDGDEVRIPLR